MTTKTLVRCLAAAALVLPALASAQQAFTTHLLNMRAGPAQDFPVVAVLPQGTNLMVQGCTSDFSWCDVQLPDNGRGWVYAEYLSYPYHGNNVPVRSMGASIGIPILVFGLGAYWASHYRDRPWYNNQSQWDHHRPRPPQGRPPYQRPPNIGHPPPRPHPPIEGRPPSRPHPGDRPPGVRPPRPDNRPDQGHRPGGGQGGHQGGGGRPGGGGEHRPGGGGPGPR